MKNFSLQCGYFKNEAFIDVPEVIQNSISDVFKENDEIDQVVIYFPEEAEEFAKDLTLKTELFINIDGQSNGIVQNVYTYYGDPEYFMNEKIILVKDGEVYEEIRDTYKSFNGKNTILYELNDYYVILLEEIKFENGNSTKELILLIYCPESINYSKKEDDKFKEIYNKLMEDEK